MAHRVLKKKFARVTFLNVHLDFNLVRIFVGQAAQAQWHLVQAEFFNRTPGMVRMPRGQVKIKQTEIRRVGRAVERLGLSIRRIDVEGEKYSYVVGDPGKAVDDSDDEKSWEKKINAANKKRTA